MRRFRLQSVALVAAALSLSACNLKIPTTTLAQGKQSQPTTPQPQQNTLASTRIVGAVMAPAGVIAAGGGNVIAAGGGNVIAPGGGNYRVTALGENPLANTEVFLANAAGTPYPIGSVKTDDKGAFSIPNVPAGFTFMVVAKVKTHDGKDAQLQTLVKSTQLGATANVSASTTLVTTSVVAGRGDSLGSFNEVTFKNAVDATAGQLTPDTLPDLADKTAMLAVMTKLEADVAAIKTSLDELKKDLAEIKTSINDLNTKIDELSKQKQTLPPPPPPPTGTTQPPPPTGMMTPPPPPPPTGTTQPNFITRTFALNTPPTDPTLYPVTVEFHVPKQPDQIPLTLTFNTPDARIQGKVPADLPHDVSFKTRNDATPRFGIAGFVVRSDSPTDISLPLPFGTGTSGTTTGTGTTGTTTGGTTTTGTTTAPKARHIAGVLYDGTGALVINTDVRFWSRTSNKSITVTTDVEGNLAADLPITSYPEDWEITIKATYGAGLLHFSSDAAAPTVDTTQFYAASAGFALKLIQ